MKTTAPRNSGNGGEKLYSSLCPEMLIVHTLLELDGKYFTVHETYSHF